MNNEEPQKSSKSDKDSASDIVSEGIAMSLIASFPILIIALCHFSILPGILLMLYSGYGLIKLIIQSIGFVKFLIAAVVSIGISALLPPVFIVIVVLIIIFNLIHGNYQPLLYLIIGLILTGISSRCYKSKDDEDKVVVFLLSIPTIIVNIGLYLSFIGVIYGIGYTIWLYYQKLGILWTLVSLLVLPLMPIIAIFLGSFTPILLVYGGLILFVILIFISFPLNMLFSKY